MNNFDTALRLHLKSITERKFYSVPKYVEIILQPLYKYRGLYICMMFTAVCAGYANLSAGLSINLAQTM